MSIWAIVPAKDPGQAKSRLAPVLSPAMRRVLSLRLLEATLQTVEATPSIVRCLVISSGPEPLALARQHQALAVHELGVPQVSPSIVTDEAYRFQERSAPEGRLNAALHQAASIATRGGATALLVLPADLLLLTSAALADFLALLPDGPGLVLAPDRHGSGTNALLVRPPLAVPFLFGPHSFDRHREAAAARDIPYVVHQSDSFAIDLDTPGDLELLSSMQPLLEYQPEPRMAWVHGADDARDSGAVASVSRPAIRG